MIKKKIKELTHRERLSICLKHQRKCIECPLFYQNDIVFCIDRNWDIKETIKDFFDREIEVDE